MKPVTSILLGSLMLAACNDPPQGPSPAPDFRVSPARQWSGGTVEIASTEGIRPGALPAFYSHGVQLSALRLDDSTAQVSLPEDSSSTLTIFAEVGTRRVRVGDVSLAGFRERREAEQMSNELYPVRDHSNQLRFLGQGVGGLALFDPASGLTTHLMGLNSPDTYGVGPTSHPDRFIVRDSSRLLTEWQLFPTPVVVDTVFDGMQYTYTRQVARLSDSVWLFTHSHEMWTQPPSIIPQLFYGRAESPWSIHISPRGDRAVVTSNGFSGLPGVPVLDAISGDTAFTVSVPTSGLPAAEYAVFSNTGAELTLLGGEYSAPRMLVRVDAATGAVESLDSLPAGVLGVALAVDGAGKYLIAYALRNDLPVLYLYDASTLKILGVLPAPDLPENHCLVTDYECFGAAVAVDDGTHTAFVAIPGPVTRVFSFDLLP